MLYFGDSLRSDIVPAKKYAEWDTVFIYEEMEAEMAPARKPRAASESNKNGDEGGEPVRKKLKTNGSLIVDEKSVSQFLPSFRVRDWCLTCFICCRILFVHCINIVPRTVLADLHFKRT